MDLQTLSKLVPDLILEGKFKEAETKLLDAHREASKRSDMKALGEHILPLLVQLYCSLNPPNFVKAEAFSRERENADPRAYHELQTAMMFYYVANDYPRAVAKLEEAINHGKAENDDSTVYSALSVLGQALLQLDRKREAVRVLQEIEKMVLAKKPSVIGDETLFLETAMGRGLELPTVKRIASILAPVCRDPEFGSRLKALAENEA
jgi:hypothetical protein